MDLKTKDQIKKLDEKETKMKKVALRDRRKRMVIEMRVGVELEVQALKSTVNYHFISLWVVT